MRNRLLAVIERVEGVPLSLAAFALSFLAIVGGRLTLESFLANFPFQFSDYYFYFFTHHLLTFLLIFLVSLPIFRWAGRTSLPSAATVLLSGFFIIWTPPIIDEVISRGEGLWSFYAFDSLAGLWARFLTFFGDQPDMGITYGIRVEIALALMAVAAYAWIKTGAWWRGVVAAVLLYSVLFVVAASPSFVAMGVKSAEKSVWAVNANDIAGVMLTPVPLFGLTPPNVLSSLAVKMSVVFAVIDLLLIAVMAFVFTRPVFLALWKNTRFPQMCYHGGLLLLGGLFVFLYGSPVFVPDLFHALGLVLLILAVVCAWLASVVADDLHDEAIDRLSNPSRPLPSGAIPRPLYQTLGLLFFLASIILGMIVSTQIGLLLLAYQGLAWLSSATPLRLKRFPFIATSLAGIASLLIFFAGYIAFNEPKDIVGLPWQIPLFLLVTYTLLFPLKDFKNIESDRSGGVATLPVLIGETWAKRFLGAGLFLLFVGSVFLLRLEHLFPLALVFGSLAYWIVHLAKPKHGSFSYDTLFGWVLFLIVAYGLLAFLFFS